MCKRIYPIIGYGAPLLITILSFIYILLSADSAKALNTRTEGTNIDIGSGFYATLQIKTSQPCQNVITSIDIAPSGRPVAIFKDEINDLVGTVANQFYALLIDKNMPPPIEYAETKATTGGQIIRIFGAQKFILSMERFVSGYCQNYSGDLLLLFGRGSVRGAAYWIKVSNGTFVSVILHGYSDGTSFNREVYNAFMQGKLPAPKVEATTESPSPDALEFQRRLGAELSLETVDGNRFFRIGKMQFGGALYLSGLRTGDLILNVIDSDLNSTQSIDALYKKIKKSEPNKYWTFSTRQMGQPSLLSSIIGNYKTIFIMGEDNISNFRAYKWDENNDSHRLNLEIDWIAGSEKNPDKRETAAKLALHSNTKFMNIFLSLYRGNASRIADQGAADFRVASITTQGIKAVSSLLGSYPQNASTKFIGLAAQYAILKNKLVGLCGYSGKEFTVTTKEYTIYRNLAGTYYNRTQTGEKTDSIIVDARFAQAVSLGSETGRVDDGLANQIIRFIILQGCDGQLLKAIEDNLLAHVNGAGLTKNPAVEIMPRKEAAGIVNACGSYVQSARPDATASQRGHYCSCLAEGILTKQGYNSRYIDTAQNSGFIKDYYKHISYYENASKIQQDLESGAYTPFDVGCAHYFEGD